MRCLMSLHQTLQGNERKAKSPARHREAYRSRLVRLGYEVMEDRVLLSAALPDYHFTAPVLVAGTTQHNAPSSIGAFTKTPGGTTYGSVCNGSMQAVLPAAPSFTATAVSATGTSVHNSYVHSRYAYDAFLYSHYAYVNSPSGSSAHLDAYYAAIFSYDAYETGNATYDYDAFLYSHYAYVNSPSGSSAHLDAYYAAIFSYDAYLGD